MIGGDTELAAPVHTILDNWAEMRDMIPEGIETLKKCAAMGKKLYIISNYHDRAFDVIERKYDFFRLFDGKVISSRVLMIKPDPDIYHHAELLFNLDPGRTLFIDDSPANVAVAMACGWQGICYNRPGRLAKFFGLRT